MSDTLVRSDSTKTVLHALASRETEKVGTDMVSSVLHTFPGLATHDILAPRQIFRGGKPDRQAALRIQVELQIGDFLVLDEVCLHFNFI